MSTEEKARSGERDLTTEYLRDLKYPLHILAVLWYNDHSQEAGEVFEAITQKQTPGEVATPRGSFCAYLPLPCLSSHLQT